MKKKFQLLLPLLTLPLLTSCPPSTPIYGPCFVVNNMDYGTTVDFALSDGFDVEVSFGLYDRAHDTVTERDNNRTFMFLIKDPDDAKGWMPIYRIEEKYSRCGWKQALLNDKVMFSQKATIHFGEEIFTKEIGCFYLSIAEILNPDSDVESFAEYVLSFPPDYSYMDSELFSYYVGYTKVMLKRGTWPSSKDSSLEQSSSESSWSEQSSSKNSSSEQSPLDSSLSITSSEESVIE